MRRRFAVRATGALMALGVASIGVAGTSSASVARMVRIRVLGIARTGQVVKPAFTSLANRTHSIAIFNGKAVSVPAGLYWASAEVDTPSQGQSAASETLVLKRIRIARSETIYLNAIPGKLVHIKFDVPGTSDQYDIASACLGDHRGGVSVDGTPGTVYVVPFRSSPMTFAYGSFWQGSSADYIITGRRAGRIPSDPTFTGSPGQMARLTVDFRGGTTMGQYNDANLLSDGACGVGWFLVGGWNVNGLSAFTDYVTAGRWTFIVNNDVDNKNVLSYRSNLRLTAGHSRTDVFGAAVWGPSTQHSPQEESDSSKILFWPAVPFADPNQPDGIGCCDESSVTLLYGGRVLKREVLTNSPSRLFLSRAPWAGWYTMKVRSWRNIPGVVTPTDMLSPAETVVWRFYADPPTAGFEQKELPVRVARIVALGLNNDNQATPNGATPLRVQFVEPHGRGFLRAPQYPVRTAQLFASFDGGKTWQPLAVRRDGDNWQAVVQDPGNGFVALRSVVTDTRGDRSEQTIYQAYSIG